MTLNRIAVGILAGLAGAPAQAAPETLVLSPLNMLAQTHSNGLMLHFTGTYQQLDGILDFDPEAGTCHIDVRFTVRSLTAPNAVMRAQTMSKAFLDAGDFPETRYVGECRGDRLVGVLTLRGQSHPFDMAVGYAGPPGAPVSIHAEAVLNRYDWGVQGLHFVVGKMIRITDDISLDGRPPQASHPG